MTQDNTPVISLKSLLVSTKFVTVDYPGFDGFKVEVSFLTREALAKIRKKATRTVMQNRVPTEVVDEDLFLKTYVEASIKGWSGLKLEYVEQIAPVELGDADRDQVLEFSNENALMLMKASSDFDGFISSTVTDLAAFQKTNG